MKTAWRIPLVLLLVASLSHLGQSPTVALSAPERCVSLTHHVNKLRPDLRRMYLLCEVAAKRTYDMKVARRIWHDLRPVMRALDRAGICWTNVGEVVAWHKSWVLAPTFVLMWKASPAHYSVLTARRYDRGGGYFQASNGFEAAAYYVLDTC